MPLVQPACTGQASANLWRNLNVTDPRAHCQQAVECQYGPGYLNDLRGEADVQILRA